VTDAGAGLVVTEPFKSRRLLEDIPEGARALYDGAKEKRTPEEWALLWAWNDPDVSSIVVSMKDVAEAEKYLAFADAQEPIDMFAEILINKVYDVYRKKRIFSCTECRCCMPCPFDIDSPGIGALYNDYLMYGDKRVPAFLYGVRGFGEIRCRDCGLCNKHCPRHYKIMNAVQTAQEFFEEA
jgi:predicted aldo/keto reductase-like oxidoreductase